jgi:hypothetical protein
MKKNNLSGLNRLRMWMIMCNYCIPEQLKLSSMERQIVLAEVLVREASLQTKQGRGKFRLTSIPLRAKDRMSQDRDALTRIIGNLK